MLIGGFTPAVGKVYSFCKNSRILIQKHQYFYRNSFPVIFGETASNKTFTESAKDCREVSIEINGCSGASKGDEIPVNSLISPRRAFDIPSLTLFDGRTDIYFQKIILTDNFRSHPADSMGRTDKSSDGHDTAIDE